MEHMIRYCLTKDLNKPEFKCCTLGALGPERYGTKFGEIVKQGDFIIKRKIIKIIPGYSAIEIK